MIIINNHTNEKLWDIEATQEWLKELWEDHNWGHEEPDSLIELLSSALLCYKINKSEKQLILINEICMFINNNYEAKIVRVNPLILTRVIYLLDKCGIPYNDIIEKGKFTLIASLNDLSVDREIDAKVLMLMTHYNILDHEKALDIVAKRMVDDTQFILLETEKMQQQIYLWFILTSLGKENVPDRFTETAKKLEVLFAGYMLAACQKNQLDLVSLILRKMIYLEYEEDFIMEGIEFLCFQQRSNGAFGFINPVTKQNRMIEKNLIMDFHLPITHEILWVLFDAKFVGSAIH